MPQALLIAELLLKYGPTVAREIVNLFAVAAPTPGDWEKVFSLAEKSYEAYVKPKAN